MRENILLIGGMGAGKSTIGQILVDKYGYKKFSFASEVKMLAELILERPINKGVDRPFLQQLGQYLKTSWITASNKTNKFIDDLYNNNTAFKKFYNKNIENICEEDFWVKLLLNNPDFIESAKTHPFVIDDCRFIIETEVTKLYYPNTDVILVDVPEDVRIARITARDSNFDIKWLENQTETEFKKINADYIYYNYDFESEPPMHFKKIEELVWRVR